MREKIKAIVFHILYPLCYHLGAIRPLKRKKAVFVETHGRRMSDNFMLLYEELGNRGYDRRIHFLRISESGWGTIIRRSIALLFDLSNAGVILLDESNSLFGSFKIRKGSRLIQLWHACGAFKKWGYSVADKQFGDDERALKKYSGHKNYSLVTVSGQEVCWAYEEAFGLKIGGGIVKPVGVSRTDVFFSEEKKEEARRKAEALFGEHPVAGRKIAVYLPTFRGSIAEAKGPSGFAPEKLKGLSDAFVFLIKNHPFVKQEMVLPDSCRDFIRQVEGQLTVEELLLCADVLITDYSSVVFEYSLLDKPMLFYAYDYEDYDLERGFYYPYHDFVPGPILTDMEGLVAALGETDGFDRDRIRVFRKRFMSGCDGKATERIADYIETE